MTVSSRKVLLFEIIWANVNLLGWNLFVAAMTSDKDLRTNLISRVHNRASFNGGVGAFPLSYENTYGFTIQGVAR